MAFSAKITAQPGAVTRVMCCMEEQRARYDQQLLSLMDTHVAPSYAHNNRTGDDYAAYNKPGAVVHYLQNNSPKEDWMLVLDSDMLMRRVFRPKEMEASKGRAISADYRYLIGVHNDLWKNHIPQVAARNDTLAGPYGRHADQVGGFFFVHKEDLTKMAPDWLSITEDVRQDPDAWRLSGDQYVEKGGKPWISEMYGYVYGAAKHDVWHKWDLHAMHYPTYPASGVPKVTHYGLLFEVDAYKFDKHWHYDFDVTTCPPWQLGDRPTGGIFKPPPAPSELTTKTSDPVRYYQHLLAIETVTTLNAAFCDYHLSHCPPSQQLYDVCNQTIALFVEMQQAMMDAERAFKCENTQADCTKWAADGECEKNGEWMAEACPVACNTCQSRLDAAKPQLPTDALAALSALKAKLHPEAAGTGSSPGGMAGGAASAGGMQHGAQQAAASPAPSPPFEIQAEPYSTQQHQSVEQYQRQQLEVLRQQQAQQAGQKAGQQAGVPLQQAQTVKSLLLLCYRQSLSVEQIKECVAAARLGQHYAVPGTSGSPTPATGAATDTGRPGAGLPKDDTVLESITVSAATTSSARRKVDEEELTLSLNAATRPASWSAAHSSLKFAGAGGAIVLLLALVTVHRVHRSRRKPRSGMRSE